MTKLSIPLVSPEDDLLGAALKYAAAGWYVGPGSPSDRKHPGRVLGKGWPAKTSRDVEQIVEWFTGTNNLLFLHVGKSGAWVSDVDTPEKLPDVLTEAIRTQSPPHQSSRPDQPGRGHYVFLQPADRMVGNAGGALGKEWGEGRGSNGVIFVCPSSHKDEANGAKYEWLQTGDVPAMTPELDAALPTASRTADVPSNEQLDEYIAIFNDAHTQQRRPGWLKGVLKKFGTAVSGSGSRHDALVEACCWAAREALVGVYAGAAALDAISEAFVKAMSESRDGIERTCKPATAKEEARFAFAWGIAQAEDEGAESILERIKELEDEVPEQETPTDGPALAFQWFDDLAYEVDNAPPRTWLIRNVWPAADYGVLAAPPKAQKTWTSLDLAVSVATGTPWLGYKPVDTVGPVLVFVGEGGKGNTVRRIRAIAESKKVDSKGIRISVCARAPHLSNRAHLGEVADQVQAMKPALVIIDPLYLSARGANLADLYAMGAMLEDIQRICQAHQAALILVHHYNRKQGSGAERSAGAGPQEWGRVLLSADVVSRKAGELPGETVTITKLEVQGGEVPDQCFRITRRVWTDDPDELTSAMHIATTVTEDESEAVDTDDGSVKLGPGELKLVSALVKAQGARTISGLVDLIAEENGHGLHEKTMTKYLNRFLSLGWVAHEPFMLGAKDGKRWFLTELGKETHIRRSDDVTTPHVGGTVNDLLDRKAQNRRSDDVTTPHATCRVTPDQGTWSDGAPPLYKGAPDTPPDPANGAKITNGFAGGQGTTAQASPVTDTWRRSGAPVTSRADWLPCTFCLTLVDPADHVGADVHDGCKPF